MNRLLLNFTVILELTLMIWRFYWSRCLGVSLSFSCTGSRLILEPKSSLGWMSPQFGLRHPKNSAIRLWSFRRQDDMAGGGECGGVVSSVFGWWLSTVTPRAWGHATLRDTPFSNLSICRCFESSVKKYTLEPFPIKGWGDSNKNFVNIPPLCDTENFPFHRVRPTLPRPRRKNRKVSFFTALQNFVCNQCLLTH